MAIPATRLIRRRLGRSRQQRLQQRKVMAQLHAILLARADACPERIVHRESDVRSVLRRSDRAGGAMYRQRARLDLFPREMIRGIGDQFFDAREVVPQGGEYAGIHYLILTGRKRG